MQKKNRFFLFIAECIVTLAAPKILSFGKVQINLAFRSLIA